MSAAATEIMLVNGALAGAQGNTARVLDRIRPRLAGRAGLVEVTLADRPDPQAVLARAREADGFVFATGVYWDSWGSPLQQFLEEVSRSEGSDAWLGKPAAVIVTMHSVGGKAVLSRLIGVLNTFGVWVPPMAAMVYSWVAQVAVASAPDDPAVRDLWSDEDLDVVCHNLLTAAHGERTWRSWQVDDLDPRRRWLP